MIAITRYRFNLRALDSIRFASFPGSAVRGIFGHGLKRAVCVTRLAHCVDCALRRDCVHSYLFETPASRDDGRDAPHPLIFDVGELPRSIEPGQEFAVDATLVGDAGRRLPYVIEGWRRAGERGFGRTNARFDLASVDCYDFVRSAWCAAYRADEDRIAIAKPYRFSPAPDTTAIHEVRVHLLTPYRGKRDGRLITPETFTAEGFVVSLLRRIKRLAELYDPGQQTGYGELFAAATRLRTGDARLAWSDWVRYSSRQRSHMNLGGVTGVFTIEGSDLPLVSPALEAGQWLQAGKSTLFGLGCYRLEATQALPEAFDAAG